ncbi:MAG: GNAT family N-acetyltransferase, partial [Coriobacteriia bacterium]|nr:GNAT family N-acetyltransferase [Coriobacteriia bacterium]
AGCLRMWLVTTNDNRTAQDFYRKRGWAQSAVYPGAVREARILKPEIPLVGEQGTPIEDEIEFECAISRV